MMHRHPLSSTFARGAPGGWTGLVCLLVAFGVLVAVSTAAAATLPPGFQQTTLFAGVENPTGVEFAPDGRAFVAEKSGIVRVFDGLADPTPTTFIDLRTEVFNFWDRGLLGMALDPQFTTKPYVYLLYSRDAEIGGTAPKWGSPGVSADNCPTPPGPTGDGCVVSGRLVRVAVLADGTGGAPQILVDDWCQQYPSHSIGDIVFDSQGALLASGGDGASFNFTDWGQDGSPLNPCGDPPGGIGATLSPPSAEGGALRSQDFLSFSGDPTGLDGTVIRIDRTSGDPFPGNPYNNPARKSVNVRRLAAFGLRNPFRMAVRPGTDEVWLGDVGWGTWEELNRLNPGQASNFGWPCYEGASRQPAYDSADLKLCEDLYAGAGQTGPFYTYDHAAQVVPGESCPSGSSSIAGVAFEAGNLFPAAYDGALFFADYSRDCIWVMRAGAGGIPDPATRATFVAGADNPVNLVTGPDGALYYPDFNGNSIKRVGYSAGNQLPTAVITANPTSGSAPLNVALSAAASSDPDPGNTLSYAWDLDGDGQYDDSTAVSLNYTFNATVTVGLRVSDGAGGSATAQRLISVDNTPPQVTLSQPGSGNWSVGDTINYAADATDAEQGTLPASAFQWTIEIEHCPSNCHTHLYSSPNGVKLGSIVAPDHEYPSQLRFTVTVTDAGGLTATASKLVAPTTVAVTMATNRDGLVATLDSTSAATPFTNQVIRGSQNTISAPTPQTLSGGTWDFDSWAHGGARTQTVTITSPTTFTARFLLAAGGSPCSALQGATTGTTGNDTFTGTAAADGWAADAGNDTGSGAAGNDCLDGQVGSDTLAGDGDADTLYGGLDADQMNGGSGADTLAAGAAADAVYGGDGNDLIQGGLDNDVLVGEQNDDSLYGEAGNDTLNGGGHLDRLEGGPGVDYLVGGAGDDQFFAADGERDTIVCGAGNDTVQADSIDDVRPDCESFAAARFAATTATCDATSTCTAVVEMTSADRVVIDGERRYVSLGTTRVNLGSTEVGPITTSVNTALGRRAAQQQPNLRVRLTALGPNSANGLTINDPVTRLSSN